MPRRNKRAQFQPHPDQLDLVEYIQSLGKAPSPMPEPNPPVNWTCRRELRPSPTNGNPDEFWCVVELSTGQHNFRAAMQLTGYGHTSGQPLPDVTYDDAMMRLIGAITTHAREQGWIKT